MDWRNGIPAYFGSLTMQAAAGPSGYVSAEGWPHKLVPDHLAGSLDARVAESVDGLEDSLSPGERYERSRWAVGDIDK